MATVPGLRMIQINTDGLTVRVPRAVEWLVAEVCVWWQGVTRLTLEETRYAQMFIRDVNNYLAVSEAGRSEEHTSELQSLMRISYAVFCLKKKKRKEDK